MRHAARPLRRNPRPPRRAGFTVIEMLVYGMISILLGAGLWSLLRAGYDSQYEIVGQNMANANTRQAVDTLIDKLRGTSGLTAAAKSDVTFTDSGGNSVRYWLSGTNLQTTTNALPAGGSTAFYNVSGLTFLYYTWNGVSWTTSNTPATPGTVGFMDITMQVTVDGASRQITGSVRLREK